MGGGEGATAGKVQSHHNQHCTHTHTHDTATACTATATGRLTSLDVYDDHRTPGDGYMCAWRCGRSLLAPTPGGARPVTIRRAVPRRVHLGKPMPPRPRNTRAVVCCVCVLVYRIRDWARLPNNGPRCCCCYCCCYCCSAVLFLQAVLPVGPVPRDVMDEYMELINKCVRGGACGGACVAGRVWRGVCDGRVWRGAWRA